MKKILLLFFLSVFLYSCKDQPRELEFMFEEVNFLNYKDAYQCLLKGENYYGENGVNFTSDIPRIAKIEDNYWIKGQKIGSTVIRGHHPKIKITNTCKIIIPAIYQIFHDPYFDFGKLSDTVLNKENRVIKEQTDDFISYFGENDKLDSIVYKFSESTSLLDRITCFIPKTTVSDSLVSLYLDERYYILNVIDSIYENVPQTIEIQKVNNSNQWVLEYQIKD